MKPLIFAACDETYYERFAKPFENSAKAAGMDCLIHNGGKMDRGKATSLRYFILPDLLKNNQSILVLDIDSIINEPIDIPDKWDIGLFLRPGMESRKAVMGSVFYIHSRAGEFAYAMQKHLRRTNLQWYDDQYGLWKTYLKFKDTLKVKTFSSEFINWHCQPASIWTGKGDVKESEAFVKRLARFA